MVPFNLFVTSVRCLQLHGCYRAVAACSALARGESVLQPMFVQRLEQTRLLSSTPFVAARNASTIPLSQPSITSYDIKKHSESGLFKTMTIRSESWNYAVLDSFYGFIERTVDELGLERGSRVRLPTHRKKYTVLSSPHVSKKHRSQIRNITEKTASSFIDYIMKHSPPGISSRVLLRSIEAVPGISKENHDKT
eukprot:gene9742-1946_t